jgi:hypothetical protein
VWLVVLIVVIFVDVFHGAAHVEGIGCAIAIGYW